MLPSYILSLREGLEAALIIGIVLGALRQMRRKDLYGSVWLGAGIAALVSLLAAVVLTTFGLELKDPAEAIFEGLTMLLAASILTWMIFWMARQSRNMKAHLQSGVLQASRTGKRGLFALAFIAILREGVELALFLTAAAVSSGTQQILFGALLGLGSAVLLGWLLFASTVKLDLQRFFQVTGFLLILFAAGLLAYSVHEFIELGWLPGLVPHVWDINPILHEESTLGQVLHSLLGYNPSPSLTEVLVYLGYFAVILFGMRSTSQKVRPPVPQE